MGSWPKVAGVHDVRSIESAQVLRDRTRVGTLMRTTHGAVFEYDRDWLEQRDPAEEGIALHLPYAQRRFETFGVNLHPFFAGLLPEGLRLEAVLRRTKTSVDDLFSILIATGRDLVGDVSVIADASAADAPPRAAPQALEEASFGSLLEESLGRAGEPSGEPTIPGVQEKISAAMISFPVQLASPRAAHILKLNPADKPRLIENEAFFMAMARDCGLETADVKLVRDREGQPGLLVTRFDRQWRRDQKRLAPIHQEDACQFLNRYPADKYRLSCREIAEGLSVCGAPIPARARLLRLIAFSYLIANGDLHAKNISVFAPDGPTEDLTLTPAYDLLSTLPYGDRRMALKLEGRDDDLAGRWFLPFGERLGVRPAAVRKMCAELHELSEPWIDRVPEIGLDDRRTSDLQRVMRQRRQQLVDFGSGQ